jgi:hypothetical protein
MGVYLLDLRKVRGSEAEYILSTKVARYLEREEDEMLKGALIYPLVDKDGGCTFWPVLLGDKVSQKGPSEYLKSSREVIEKARLGWVSIQWRTRKGGGWWARSPKSQSKFAEPVWPPDLQALFFQVIADRYIADRKDTVIREYLGED